MRADHIKQIALSIFSEKGYEGASLSQIAKQVGIKTPSLYAHFESKEELFLSIYRDVVEKEYEDIEQSLSLHHNQSPKERISSMFFFFTQFERRSVEKKFLQRFLFFPPVHLKNKLKEEFINSETLSSKIIMEILLENDETLAKNDDLLYTFYCLLDGLLLEQSIYSEEEYKKRQQAVWNVFDFSLRNGVSL